VLCIMLLTGLAIAIFGVYVCLVRIHIYYVELGYELHPMIHVKRELLIWIIAALFVVIGLHLARIAMDRAVRKRFGMLSVVEGFGIGVGTMLCGIACFYAGFYIYLRDRFGLSNITPEMFGSWLISTLRAWGFSTAGLFFLFIGSPAAICILGFLSAMYFRVRTLKRGNPNQVVQAVPTK